MDMYFYPTMVEVEEAEAVFKAGVSRYMDGDNSNYTVIRCALADVWEAARRYEYDKGGAKLLENQNYLLAQ